MIDFKKRKRRLEVHFRKGVSVANSQTVIQKIYKIKESITVITMKITLVVVMTKNRLYHAQQTHAHLIWL